jgi:hypothetical protein
LGNILDTDSAVGIPSFSRPLDGINQTLCVAGNVFLLEPIDHLCFGKLDVFEVDRLELMDIFHIDWLDCILCDESGVPNDRGAVSGSCKQHVTIRRKL